MTIDEYQSTTNFVSTFDATSSIPTFPSTSIQLETTTSESATMHSDVTTTIEFSETISLTKPDSTVESTVITNSLTSSIPQFTSIPLQTATSQSAIIHSDDTTTNRFSEAISTTKPDPTFESTVITSLLTSSIPPFSLTSFPLQTTISESADTTTIETSEIISASSTPIVTHQQETTFESTEITSTLEKFTSSIHPFPSTSIQLETTTSVGSSMYSDDTTTIKFSEAISSTKTSPTVENTVITSSLTSSMPPFSPTSFPLQTTISETIETSEIVVVSSTQIVTTSIELTTPFISISTISETNKPKDTTTIKDLFTSIEITSFKHTEPQTKPTSYTSNQMSSNHESSSHLTDIFTTSVEDLTTPIKTTTLDFEMTTSAEYEIITSTTLIVPEVTTSFVVEFETSSSQKENTTTMTTTIEEVKTTTTTTTTQKTTTTTSTTNNTNFELTSETTDELSTTENNFSINDSNLNKNHLILIISISVSILVLLLLIFAIVAFYIKYKKSSRKIMPDEELEMNKIQSNYDTSIQF